LTDRHYALFANNQHPIQLAAYEEYNKFLISMHDAKQVKGSEITAEQFDQVV
jgi:hypothetical protein